jgi:hypothetical protein
VIEASADDSFEDVIAAATKIRASRDCIQLVKALAEQGRLFWLQHFYSTADAVFVQRPSCSPKEVILTHCSIPSQDT